MFKCLQLILTTTLLSALTLPAVAQNDSTPAPSIPPDLFATSDREQLEWVFFLAPVFADGNGERQIAPAEACSAEISIDAREIEPDLGMGEVIDVSLEAGDHQVVSILPMDPPGNGDLRLLLLRFPVFDIRGPCLLVEALRLYNTLTAETVETLKRGCSSRPQGVRCAERKSAK